MPTTLRGEADKTVSRRRTRQRSCVRDHRYLLLKRFCAQRHLSRSHVRHALVVKSGRERVRRGATCNARMRGNVHVNSYKRGIRLTQAGETRRCMRVNVHRITCACMYIRSGISPASHSIHSPSLSVRVTEQDMPDRNLFGADSGGGGFKRYFEEIAIVLKQRFPDVIIDREIVEVRALRAVWYTAYSTPRLELSNDWVFESCFTFSSVFVWWSIQADWIVSGENGSEALHVSCRP